MPHFQNLPLAQTQLSGSVLRSEIGNSSVSLRSSEVPPLQWQLVKVQGLA